MRSCTLALLGIVATLVAYATRSVAASDAIQVSGQVVDADGRPVPGAAVAFIWSANGIPRDDQGIPWPSDDAGFQKLIDTNGWHRVSKQVGTMEPHWRASRATTDATGRFTLERASYQHVLLAMDAERRRGALVILEPGDRMPLRPLVLRELVHVHGTLTIAGQPVQPKWTNVTVDLENRFAHRPLDLFRVLGCGSYEGTFSFKLPPGRYTLGPYCMDPESQVAGGVAVELDGSRADVDLGPIDLQPATLTLQSRVQRWQTKGDRGDYKRHFGRVPPKWFIADARGAAKDVQLTNYRGKWVVLEFWNFSCVPCLKRDLPDWTAFYDERRAQRDRFEILSICVDVDEDLDSIDEVEQRLRPIVEHVWAGRELPFPILLDARLKTWQSFGLDFMAQTLLVDPQGNLTAAVGHEAVRNQLGEQLDFAK